MSDFANRLGKHARPQENKPRVSDAVARPARTAIQGGAGYAVAELVDSFVGLTDGQVFWLAAVLTLAFSYAQTLIENHLGAGLLRQVPPTTAPVVDEGGESALGMALTVLVVVVIVILLLRAFG